MVRTALEEGDRLTTDHCPWCDHVFMWNENCGEGLILHEYRFKETGKLVEKAKCPKCSMDMVVLEHVLN